MIEKLWVTCGYLGGRGAMSLVEKWSCECVNKLVKRKAFFDIIRDDRCRERKVINIFYLFSAFSFS